MYPGLLLVNWVGHVNEFINSAQGVVQAHETRLGMLGKLWGRVAAIAFSNRVMRQPAPDTTQ